MKILKSLLVVLIILLIGGYNVSHHLYDEKYDDYYDEVVWKNTYAAAQNGTLKMRVSITADQIEYHHLGRDITTEYTCNNKTVTDGDIIPYNKNMTFVATIIERDSIDDVGVGKTAMRLPPYKNKATTIVRVDEEGGRKYADAYAIWEVTFEVEPILNDLEVGFWEVVFS